MARILRMRKLITAYSAVIEGAIRRNVVVKDTGLVEKIGRHIYVQIFAQSYLKLFWSVD